ncbi:signal transduction histidine kinase [Pseudoalteromonas luteoviolacea B = ATCC 29581]|nr:signal transduction histidine kinase [Pseudoalteromonas luteoviolacea B = ATCC 29581]
MPRKEVDHCERHPKVVLITDDIDECLGVSEIIKSQIDAFRVLVRPADIYQVLIDSKPVVVLFAYKHIATSVESYAELIEKNLFGYAHQTIVLCDNKESGVAFRCCIKGIFNDYFVHKPMYENFRLRLILQNMLTNSEGEEEVNRLREAHFGKIDEGIVKLIDEVAIQHKELTNSIEQVKQVKLAQAITEQNTIASKETPAIEASDGTNDILLDMLRVEYLDPLISTLESQLSHNIVDILDKLKKSREDIQSCNEQIDSYKRNERQLKQESVKAFVAQENDKKKSKIAKPNTQNKPEEVEVVAPHQSNDGMCRIMVVDDNEIYREMICKVLREEGYVADGYESGTKAIDVLREKSYHAIFMDLFMPGLDGYNTTKNIRQMKGYEKLPIVALTGNRDKELIRKWAQFGLVGYIAKPATKQAILAALAKASLRPCQDT